MLILFKLSNRASWSQRLESFLVLSGRCQRLNLEHFTCKLDVHHTELWSFCVDCKTKMYITITKSQALKTRHDDTDFTWPSLLALEPAAWKKAILSNSDKYNIIFNQHAKWEMNQYTNLQTSDPPSKLYFKNLGQLIFRSLVYKDIFKINTIGEFKFFSCSRKY